MSFTTNNDNENALLIHIPEEMAEIELKQFDVMSKEWIKADAEKIILDFSNTSMVDEKSYRHIAMFLKTIKSSEKFMYSIGLSDKLLSQLRRDGMSIAMNIKPSLESVLKHKHKVEASIKAEFVTNVTQSVTEVFNTQIGVNVSLTKARIKQKGEETLYDIVSLLSINSNAFQGTLALCFPKQCYLNVYNQMLGESATEIDEENRDAAAELLNMIFGMAKSKLMNNKNVEIDKAIPSVLTGEKIKLQTNSSEVGLIVPMNSDAGMIVVEISFSAIHE